MMRNLFDKLVKISLSAAMVLSSLMLVFPETVSAAEVEYEIYPTPQSIQYQEGSFLIQDGVNVVVESTIDDVTKNHLTDVLSLKLSADQITEGEERVEGKTNIFVGTYGSEEYVDTYAKEHYEVDKALFDHFGSYFFTTMNDDIVILGRDSDAAFYGITTLKMIFNQIDGISLRHVTMNDYADVNIRGFIEGYYGIPWSNEDRMELMKFGGDIKMTSYIFAPKDDPYHKEKWREPYPAEELEALKEMVKVGNETKCRFVWTAHPFMGGFNGNKADEEIETLIQKFEHLYNDAGVRQFGVLGDDVGNLPRSVVVKMMTRVGEWAKSKGDVYDVVFCPGGYNHSWQGNYSELNEYDAGFPDNIQIFWTGEAVCQPIEQKTLDHFRNHNAVNGTRRAPLFWLNWPVNDINHSRMIMGHGTKMLHTDINVNDLAGAVTNPMQESEPSKVAIFQLADYAWNIKQFNGKKTWEDSFKYIEPNASEEMHTLAKHMSNPEPNGHWLVMPESEDIAPILTQYKDALKANNVSAELSNSIKAEFNRIIEACDGFNAKSQNEEMKKDLAPFVASLKDLSTSIVRFVEAKEALDAKDQLIAFDLYTEGQDAFKASSSHRKPMLGGGTEIVDPGSTQLIPFAQTLEETLAKDVGKFVSGEGNKKLEITATSSFNSFEQGPISNIIDGNPETNAWFNGYERAGQFYQVNFNIPQTVYGIHILNGAYVKNNPAKLEDTFGTGELKYKVEGQEEWKSLGEFKDYPERVDVSQIELENVVAVRYECKAPGNGNRWPSMREFTVSIEPENDSNFTKEALPLMEGWSIYSGNGNMLDGNPNSYTHFNVRQGHPQHGDTYLVDDYYGVKLSKEITLGKIDILQAKNDSDGDYFTESKLQYSTNGTEWKDIPGATQLSGRHITFDASDLNLKAQYVRLVARDTRNVWVAVREFNVEAKMFFNAKAYTNVEALKNLGANIKDDYFELASKQNVTLQPNEYLGLKLDRIHELTEIQVANTKGLTLEVGLNEYQFGPYKQGDSARYIRLINKTDKPVTFDFNGLTVRSREIYPRKLVDNETNMTIHENNDAGRLFDGDWNTAAWFNNSQVAGKKFVIDLGQEVDISKFKVVARDSEHDYPRHAKISVSSDLKTWQDLMELGNQTGDNEGEATNQDHINSVLPTHETSYNTKEVVLNKAKQARYIKFEITRNKAGSDKWIRLQEFVINDGAYIPSENNPTYESNVLDTLGGEYSNVDDGNLKTTFIPSKDKGTLTYHVSYQNNRRVIKIVQARTPISDANVKATILEGGQATILEGGQGAEKTVVLGTLSQTVNEFILPENTILLNVSLEWKDVVPNIAELMITNDDSVVLGQKDALKALLDETVDTTTWTKKSVAAYEKAMSQGRKVFDSPLVSQSTVDSARKAIQNAKAKAETKGDVSVLEAIVANKETDASLYTQESWRAYTNVMLKVEAALKDKDSVSSAQVDALKAEFDAVTLVYSPLKAEQGTVTLAAMKDFVASVKVPRDAYTKESWENLQKAMTNLETVLKQNETEVVPSEIAEYIKAVKTAHKNLVAIDTLVAEINEFTKTDGSLYTKDSYEAYRQEVEAAKVFLEKATAEEVKTAVEKIQAAKANLEVVADVSSLKALIAEIRALPKENYTAESYANVLWVADEVEAALDTASSTEIANLAKQLTDAKNGLVNIVALRDIVERANSYEEVKYTTSSYHALKEALKPTIQLMKTGSTEEVSKAVESVHAAINGLALRVNVTEMNNYMDGITFDSKADAYTKESYEAYKKAYDHLVQLTKNPADVSAEDFYRAVEAFENASKLLQPAVNVGPQDKPATGDTTRIAMYGVLLLACAAYVAYDFSKKRLSKH